MHSIANLNPKSVVSPQPYEFTELYREDQSQTTPHDSREDPGGTDLRKCVLGGDLKPAQSAGDQVLTTSLTYLLGLETICSLCISVSGKPIVPELRSGFPL